MPVSEVAFGDVAEKRFRRGYLETFGPATSGDPLYDAVSAGQRYPGIEHWLPLFHERLETLFDYVGAAPVSFDHLAEAAVGERLALIDWQGGGRFGVTPPNCGGRGAAPAAPAAPVNFGQRTQIPKMTVRFKTTAGLHKVGVTFPQTNFAPVLDLDQHFQRDTLQTGPTPGFTFFPHVGIEQQSPIA